ncbi:MTND-like protein [Mya arenaria]|uniref:Acireductone dioxygenase n=1 Tax=Mya arenaria TaxID=6604 RepID=A0ABY7F545_MYAAR|nr:MTND-like protein [Mya arenaria]
MVSAWFMNEDKSVDQREPHQMDPPQPVQLEKLAELGVLYLKIESDDWDKDEALSKIRKERGYTYEDCITLKVFFQEHIHDDEEIRLCTEGSGYFDVRDRDDRWIRIELNKGDMIILPAGIYHRTVYFQNYIQARRYFVGDPVWTPINRPADEHVARKQYITNLQKA